MASRTRGGKAPAILAAAALALFGVASAQSPYSIDTTAEIKQSARTLAYDMMTFYTGNQSGMIPGILPGPPDSGLGDYYWWQGGAMMGAYIDYWYYTGDESYNHVVYEGMLHQVGDARNYEPKNHTLSLGNDDQGFWGMSAMTAAELGFQDPPKDEDQPQWLALAQGVWNRMNLPERHETDCNGGQCCGGGMRWQIPISNKGYNYKNTISNGCFFNIGARLARYTGNDTYFKKAEETWEWLWNVNYIDHDLWRVYDGGHVDFNCTDIDKATFSYNIGILLQGAAFLYNYTNGTSTKWEGILDNLTDRMMKDFFPNNTAYEVSCEPNRRDCSNPNFVEENRAHIPCEDRRSTCSRDMLMFKGFVSRWLPTVAQVAPRVAEKIRPILRDSAQAAISQCTGGESGRQCGFYWSSGEYFDVSIDVTSGAGEQLNVLSAVVGLLMDDSKGPMTNLTGGTSIGDVNAGEGPSSLLEFAPITTADRAGAGIITAIFAIGATALFIWLSLSSSAEYEAPLQRPGSLMRPRSEAHLISGSKA